MYSYSHREITIRELIASIIIVCVFITGGIFISNKITASNSEKAEKYNTAIQIESDDLFKYALDTKVGNILVYGTVNTVDPVYFDGYGPFSCISREEEHYEPHTETYTVTDSDGETHTETRTVWDWEHYHTDYVTATQIEFRGQIYKYGEIAALDGSSYLDTVKFAPSKRYVYRGYDLSETGTMYLNSKDGTITGNKFYSSATISNVIERMNSNVGVVIFWVFDIIVMLAAIFAFCMADNYWLEDTTHPLTLEDLIDKIIR